MTSRFLKAYMDAFYSIEGWFSPDAALMFMAYNQLIEAEGISGDVLEIGVYQGLSSIAIASLRGDKRLFYAIDLFVYPEGENRLGFPAEYRSKFVQNFESFYRHSSFLRIVASNSSDVSPEDLPSEFSFCHVDGGHSPEETYHDFDLCWRTLLPGGLLAVDDYFNPFFPGVSEGAIQFMLDHPDELIPIAIGFNKVLFQKAPVPFDLNQKFTSFFDHVNFSDTILWKKPALVFDSGFRIFFDLDLSEPHSLMRPAGYVSLSAKFEPQMSKLKMKPGETVQLPVRVINNSKTPFHFVPGGLFGLSYHLLSADGSMMQWDNPRIHFLDPFPAGTDRIVHLPIQSPGQAGHYQIEIDIVWENNTWFKTRGNPTCIIYLAVV